MLLRMKVKAIDISNLKLLSSFSKRSQLEIMDVIDLYKSRQIERVDTARNIINNLSSGGKVKQLTGLDQVSFYTGHYKSRTDEYKSGEKSIV